MLKIDDKEEMTVIDISEVFKKSKELHGIRPEGNIIKKSRSF